MPKFRKKPVVIEAFQFTRESVLRDAPGPKLPEWAQAATTLHVTEKVNGSEHLIVRTLEGDMTAWPGDWLIKGVKGEVYPCKPDIFKATYEPVEEATS